MTTSVDQSQRAKMRKLPAQSRARRQLFKADLQEQAAIDNFANILQESCIIDTSNMIRKWNFDFENDVALEGPYEWYRKDQDSWIGMKPVPETLLEDKFVPIEKENQMTPRVTAAEAPPVIRRRKRDGSFLCDTGAKRKISFD